MANEADILRDETVGFTRVPKEASRPYFSSPYKRKRAYHRALKRKEPWAVFENIQRQMGDYLVRELFKETLLSRPLGADIPSMSVPLKMP